MEVEQAEEVLDRSARLYPGSDAAPPAGHETAWSPPSGM